MTSLLDNARRDNSYYDLCPVCLNTVVTISMITILFIVFTFFGVYLLALTLFKLP